jgi:Mg2+-importing ATPase
MLKAARSGDHAIIGPLSSLFDLATFGILIVPCLAEEFRTTWFLESMITQIMVIFIVRTMAAAGDLPRPALAASSLLALPGALAHPFTAAGSWFGFRTRPPMRLARIGIIVALKWRRNS